MQVPPVRVIVRLPYNRPEQPPPDPAPVSHGVVSHSYHQPTHPFQVSWNSDKESYLWEVVAKSRGSEGGAPNCESLIALPRTI
jgi:hypothetical protein